MYRSVDTWKQEISNKTPEQIAAMILKNLIGYRQTSLDRVDDLDNLANLIKALEAK